MNPTPSLQQLDLFDLAPPGRVVLFYEFSHREPGANPACVTALGALATQHGGALRWAAREEQILCGRIAQFQQACTVHFPERGAARRFVTSEAHRAAVGKCTALQVAALSAQSRLLRFISAAMARVLPHWPFDDTIEPGEEPGVDRSTVMPTSAAIAQVRAHPQQDTPVVMINWLKFRPRAAYADGAAPVPGQVAYHRYGKVALLTTHSLGAKLVLAARYRQILIGHGGDPAAALWDEFALMQYPGRATFGLMASLRRYRRALHHREAGLAEHGQGLAVSRPLPEFVWRAEKGG
jgi:hypothetical protein